MILKNLAIVIAWTLPQMAGATVYNVTPADNLSATINKLKAGDELYLADGQEGASFGVHFGLYIT